jgi:thiol:disulfide interchange protein DsbD
MKHFFLLLFSSILLFSAQPKFLTPEEAFKPIAKVNDKMQIEVSIKIAKDIYVYADSIKLDIKSKNGISILNFTTPKIQKHDEDEVYLNSPTFIVNLKKEREISGVKTIKLKLSYQGCSQDGLCYQPSTKSFNLDVDVSKLIMNKEIKIQTKKNELSESDAIADTIKSGSVFMILLTFFGFGLLLSLTPCVFPMIPIISGVIISHGKGITTKKAFLLSVVYVLSMAVAYTIAGVLAGLFGSNLQSALQTPWVIYSFSGIFVALAMSMFGFYELKLPDSLIKKVSSSSKKSSYAGVAIMGFLSALIVGPCVAAPLAGALVYIGQTGDAILGGSALFFMSIGMGIPLILVGVSAGKFMPKPGAWMNMISAVFGVMMLGVAIWMLERVVDNYIIMLLYSILGICFAIYLGVFENKFNVFIRSVAVIIFIYSVSLFIGALGGSKSMTKPLEFLKQQTISASEYKKSEQLKFIKVTSILELDKVLSKNSGKKIMLDFTAKWCVSCKELDEITFSNERVKIKMAEFVLIKADITDNTQNQKKLSKKYGVFGPPAILFFNENTELIKSKTIVGFIEPEEFLAHLNQI